VDDSQSGDLEARASLALKFLAAINVLGMILASFGGTTPVATLELVAFHLAGGGLAVIYALVAHGLDRERTWARAVVRPLLWLLLIIGTLTFVSGLLAGALRIPVTALTAGVALLIPAERSPAPRAGRHAAAIVVTVGALSAMQLASPPLFGWAGLLDMGEGDLNSSLTADCGPTAEGLPGQLTISYDWSWSRGAILPSGEDQVVIGWTARNESGQPLYVFQRAREAEEGINPGTSAGASGEMAGDAADKWGRLLHMASRPGQNGHAARADRGRPATDLSRAVRRSAARRGRHLRPPGCLAQGRADLDVLVVKGRPTHRASACGPTPAACLA
jgi:hypothetical protein